MAERSHNPYGTYEILPDEELGRNKLLKPTGVPIGGMLPHLKKVCKAALGPHWKSCDGHGFNDRCSQFHGPHSSNMPEWSERDPGSGIGFDGASALCASRKRTTPEASHADNTRVYVECECMWPRPVAVALCFIALSGCASVPYPYYKGQIAATKPISEDELSSPYCSRVATNADSYSQLSLGFGIALGILAGAAVVAGSAMGPDTTDGADWAARNRNALVIGAGGLLSVPTAVLLMRSKDGSRASAQATLALTKETESERMAACLRARAELVDSRSAAADAAAVGGGLENHDEFESRNAAAAAAADAAAGAPPVAGAPPDSPPRPPAPQVVPPSE